MEGENPHEEAARWRKVARLLAQLYAGAVPAEVVDVMTAEQWATLARHCGVRRPSAETVRIIRLAVAEARLIGRCGRQIPPRKKTNSRR